jgi:alanyl-tRNA synthetase
VEIGLNCQRPFFYAESGGQESEQGTISGIPVINAKKHDKTIIYTLESPPDFCVGDHVVSVIDWTRRYALMKLHFAAEIILELFTLHFPQIKKIGAHIAEDKSRIDFEWPDNINALLPDIQAQAQGIIDASLEIKSDFLDKTSERRFWKVEGVAQVPCGGTHLKVTSEIGAISLKRKKLVEEKKGSKLV